MAELSDQELLDALGVSIEPEKKPVRTNREERIVAGFEEIQKFVEEHGHPPGHGEDRDIFERLYAVRLDRLRDQRDCRELLQDLDHQRLLQGMPATAAKAAEELADDELLAELGVEAPADHDITALKHVKSRAEVRAAEEIANRRPCADFDRFKPLFAQAQKDLDGGERETRRFKKNAEINQGEFFVVGGQKAYVAEVGEEFLTEYDRRDSRLRVIYDNGTESDILLRSLQRALYKDEAGRRITETSAGPLFTNRAGEDDTESGTIYVLRSKSDHPEIAAHRDVIHKIGVTGGRVETRITNAKLDPTFLMADVEVVATYGLYNINRSKLENLIHRFFSNARLDVQIEDRFGNPIKPREWFLVPLSVVDDAVEKIRDRSIGQFEYDPSTASLREIAASDT